MYDLRTDSIADDFLYRLLSICVRDAYSSSAQVLYSVHLDDQFIYEQMFISMRSSFCKQLVCKCFFIQYGITMPPWTSLALCLIAQDLFLSLRFPALHACFCYWLVATRQIFTWYLWAYERGLFQLCQVAAVALFSCPSRSRALLLYINTTIHVRWSIPVVQCSSCQLVFQVVSPLKLCSSHCFSYVETRLFGSLGQP